MLMTRINIAKIDANIGNRAILMLLCCNLESSVEHLRALCAAQPLLVIYLLKLKRGKEEKEKQLINVDIGFI